ncbi:MAG TPA: hypothetical protein P5137_06355 [Candidatus Brocadiia bacterium]|nr:hypothetical protein [Candidatus Brocadiia bacterium]
MSRQHQVSCALVIASFVAFAVVGCGPAAPSSPAPSPDKGAAAPASAPAPAAKPKAPAKEPSWESQTVLDVITVEVPRGAGWTSAFDTWYRGQLPEPRALFAIRSGGEIATILKDAKAVSKGATTLAGLKATLYEGTDSSWGPMKMWVFVDKHPKTKVEVAVAVAGVAQEDNKATLDKIMQSLKVDMAAAK